MSPSDSASVFPLGAHVSDTSNPFTLSEEQLSRHMLVLGGTGTGKSKFLELLCRNLLDSWCGFCFIDPHGDTAEDVLAYAARYAIDHATDGGPSRIASRIHWIEPSFSNVFGYDPFQYEADASIPENLSASAHQAWLHAKVDRVCEIILRAQGDYEFGVMVRLEKYLKDVLLAVGTSVDRNGRHLPLASALTLLDFGNRCQTDIFQSVRPNLPAEVVSDFEQLAVMSVNRRDEMTGSTVNRLRSLFSPIVKAIFRETVHTIDFSKVIRNRQVLVVNLRKTNYFSREQSSVIGGLLIHEILSTMESVEQRSKRVPFKLIIDEASRYIGKDLADSLAEDRKFLLSVVLAGQHLQQFRNQDIDLIPDIMENCKTKICFQKEYVEDLEYLAKTFGYASLDFTELIHEVDRPLAYEWHTVREQSVTKTEQTSEQEGGGESEGRTIGEGESETLSEQQTYSDGTTEETGETTIEGSGRGSSWGSSNQDSQTPIIVDGDVIGYAPTSGAGSREQENENQMQSKARSTKQGKSHTDGGGTNIGHGRSRSDAKSDGSSKSWGRGKVRSRSVTKSKKQIPLLETYVDRQATGKLVRSVPDQFAFVAHQLATLRTDKEEEICEAMVRLAGENLGKIIRIMWFQAPFADAATQDRFIEIMRKRILETHPYNIAPTLDPALENESLEPFLEEIPVDGQPRRFEKPNRKTKPDFA